MLLSPFRFFTWFLLFCFSQTFLFPQSFAKEISPPAPSDSAEVSLSDFFSPALPEYPTEGVWGKPKNKKNPYLDLPIAAVLEVTSSSLPLSSLREISKKVRREVKETKKFLVYSNSEMQRALNHTLNEEIVAVRQIDKFVSEAKRLYDDFKFKAASAVIEEGMKVIPLFDASLHLLPKISEAYLTQALILYASEKEPEMKIAFLNAAALDPTRILDPGLYPPSVIEMFNQAKKEFGNIQEGSLRIESNPPVAEVFVEGKRQGTTPLTLKNLPLGVQKIRMVKEGYEPWEKHLMIISTGSNQYTNRLNTNLNKMGSAVSLNALMGEIISRKTLELQLSKVGDLGKLLFADAVFAARIEKVENGYDFFIASVDSKTGAILGKSYSVVSSDLSDLPTAIRSALSEMLTHKSPAKFTDRILVEPKGANYLAAFNNKKPFYKRWYFYVPLSIVVAGGGAGAAVLLTRGGGGSSGGAVSASQGSGPMP